ncbi:MAG TPA: hemolysin III family protein [Actinomycetes bacterium]|nr:hemolysin III family protein [Actinomycetes bacterium]
MTGWRLRSARAAAEVALLAHAVGLGDPGAKTGDGRRAAPHTGGMTDSRGAPAKPLLRGRLHQVAFVASVPAGLALVLAARTGPARLAAAVYALSLAGLYGTSAAFHLGRWSDAVHRRMDQADHAMIYVLIAGSWTPFAVLALGGPWGLTVLVGVWAAAIGGIVVVILWHRIRIVGITLYLTLGWLGLVTLPWLAGRLGIAKLTLLVAGGIFYTVGAVVLGRQRPDPNPKVFGYHEVWHAFTIAAGACHYALVWLLVSVA